jgi:hypothetical protein
LAAPPSGVGVDAGSGVETGVGVDSGAGGWFSAPTLRGGDSAACGLEGSSLTGRGGGSVAQAPIATSNGRNSSFQGLFVRI